MKPWRSLLLGIFLSNAIAPCVKSQISPDGTTNTTVNSTDNTIRIDEGDRSGDNLFHSFEQFSLSNDSEAFFNNSNDIANIFSRVTGGNTSNIEGLIRANGDANLFLINPAGIVFGEGAALDIGGSFVASTAESIVFSDDLEFSATDKENPPLLTINQPIGLNFGNSPGSIAVNSSNLEVNNGETLALFGGNVTITGGQIIAPGANVELGGLTAVGKINFSQSEDTFNSFSFPEGIARGNVTLANSTEVNVRATGGGNIGINARNIELSGGEFGASNLKAGIAAQSSSTEAQAGDITFNATNNITVNRGSGISNWVEESAIGDAGGIDITTDNLSLKQGGIVSTITFGRGNAGAITVRASGTISADGESAIGSIVNLIGTGNSSGINITTTDLSLTQGSEISASTFGRGNAGAITISADGTISVDGEAEDGSPSGISNQIGSDSIGSSSGINITTTDLSLTQGGRVSAITSGQGDGGAITIKASDTILADGETQAGIPSVIFTQVQPPGVGIAGAINLTTSNLSLTRGGRVSAITFGQGDGGAITIKAFDTILADGATQTKLPDVISILQSGIGSTVQPGATGNAGRIDITTTNLFLKQGAQVGASTAGQGDAGAITIKADGTVSADGENREGSPSGIFSQIGPDAIGDSDGINITTSDLSLTQGGQVSTGTFGRGNAGAITVRASGTISADEKNLDGFSSGIFTTVQNTALGNAADIDLNTSNLFLTNGAQISVQSLGQGNASNLSIQANTVALSNEAALFASTPVGTGGNINLQIAENLTLQDNSTISAEALENANGGNITIDADFVIAQPDRNNDLIALAAEGTGGNIDITTNALFGLEERSSIPDNNTNDLDASSKLGLDGTVEINQLDINPTEGLEELPIEVINVAGLVEQNLCQQGQGSEFVVTGKGGTATSPTQARDGEVSEVDLVEPVPFSDVGEAEEAEEVGEAEKIVEAQEWIVNDRGMVELVASKTNFNSSPAQPKAKVCHKQ